MAGTSVLRLKDDPSFKNEPEIRSFVAWLHSMGYCQSRAVAMQRVAAAFVQWLQTKPSSIAEADERHVAAFLARSAGGSKKPRVSESVALQRFLEHRRAQVPLSIRPSMTKTSVDAAIEQRYVDYLRQERGLTERSVQIYLPHIRRFLTTRAAATDATLVPSTLSAGEVREFLLNRCRARSSEYSRLLAVALRSFLCFLFLRGETETDLSLAIPKVLRWSRATVPNHLSQEQVEQIIAAPDRTIPTGRRDHAILLLLARLGLRAGEVVALDLGDIRWRTGEFVVRGKGRTMDRMPLPSDVGEALASYIQNDRGSTPSSRVFLRSIAPRVALTGPAAVGHIVRRAMALAGTRRSCRGAAHLLRHSLATRMIRNGASLAQIAEVLRHRSAGATELYAKVDFETLRSVSRSWPGAGGAQ